MRCSRFALMAGEGARSPSEKLECLSDGSEIFKVMLQKEEA